ncbi:MAG: hypothetical protein LBG78_00585 [Azoarcus sp.]|jgi:hypothetical protein|nr:hypothetical protein [Azoarcus sp.]
MKLKRKIRHSLVIGAQGLDIWRHNGSRAEHEMRIAVQDEKTHPKLQTWLAGGKRQCVIVADMDDERHIFERLPRTGRADRQHLIRRKLAQHFPDAAMTRATLLPPALGGSQHSPVLFSAIAPQQHVSLFLDAVAKAANQANIDVRCVTSIPFLIEHWFCRQQGFPPQALLLSLGAGGMRQMFFRERRMVFSRVISARASTLDDCLPIYRDELMQTLAWLASQGLAEGTPPILVLAAANELSVLRELALSASGSMEFIDLASFSSDANFLSLALQESWHRAIAHYGYPPLCRPRRLATARRALWLTAAAVGSLGVLAAANSFIDAQNLWQEAGRFNAEHRALQNELKQITAQSRPEPGKDFPAWLEQAERIANEQGISPENVLQAVARLLGEAPWAQLELLVWKKAPPAQKTATASAQENRPVMAALELDITLMGNAPPPHVAADALLAYWQRQQGTEIQLHIEPGMLPTGIKLTLNLPLLKGNTP